MIKVARRKGSKKRNKRAAKKRRLINKPSLMTGLKSPQHSFVSTLSNGHVDSLGKEKGNPEDIMSPEEIKASVVEIISDLEKQLEATFRIREAQEGDIAKLKKQLVKVDDKVTVSEAELKELKGRVVSQEELNSEVEFLENERLEAGEKIRFLEEGLEQKEVEIKEFEIKIEALAREIEERDIRMKQIELELSSTSKTVQSFQNHISLLEDEKKELLNKLEISDEQIGSMTADRDRYKKDLDKVKEDLNEIRVMLADTRTRVKERYYKKKHT